MTRAGWKHENDTLCDDCMNPIARAAAAELGDSYAWASESDPADIVSSWGMQLGVFSEDNTDPHILPVPLTEEQGQGKSCTKCHNPLLWD